MMSRRNIWTVVLVLILCPTFYIIWTQKFAMGRDDISVRLLDRVGLRLIDAVGGHLERNPSDSVDSSRIETEDCTLSADGARPSGGAANPKGTTTQVAVQTTDYPVKRILLVTYGRSGSTFTSYILKEAGGAFFFFEPLRAPLLRATRGLDIIMNYSRIGSDYMAPGELPVTKLSSYERIALDTLENLFNCDISKYPVNDYISYHFLLHGDVAELSKCLWGMVNDSYMNLSNYLQCLLHFQHNCQASPLRIFKVIRLPLRSLFRLMRNFPDLRVIYLVRDPRAVLLSQSMLFGHAPKAEDFCRMVTDDVQHMKLLQEMFPGRALAVRYEDISSSPVEYTRKLYEALQLPLSPQVISRVKQMTSSSIKKEDAYQSYRSNSKESANKWRTKINYTEVEASDKLCGKTYERLLGYKIAASEALLRNPYVSLTGKSQVLTLV